MGGEEELLTEQEAAVYDRQIRVWGVDAQKRLSKARVLAVGITGVIVETCKNMVLAGIGSLMLMDDNVVTPEAAASNFLITKEDLSGTRRSLALVCAEALTDYNPMVEVRVGTGDIRDKPEEFFDDFDAVILDRASIGVQKRVNTLCRSRSHKVAFYSVDTRYSFGSLFVDPQSVTYSSKKKADEKDVEYTKEFPSLEDVLSVRWNLLPKRTSKLFVAFRIIHEFEEKWERTPGKIVESDTPALRDFAREMLAAQGVSSTEGIEDEVFKIALAGSSELPPVSAIMGGILGQEVLKAVSGKGEPLKNYFFFDSLDGKGIIEDISP